MMHQLKSSLTTLIFLTLLHSGAVWGESISIHDGFGPDKSYSTESFLTLGKTNYPGRSEVVYQAQPFTVPPSQNMYLDSLDIALSTLSRNVPVRIQVLGNEPDPQTFGTPRDHQVLEQFIVAVPSLRNAPGSSTDLSIISLNSVTGPLLMAGKTYWLTVSPQSSLRESRVYWWKGVTNPHQSKTRLATRVNLGPWEVVESTSPGQAFRIQAIPENSSQPPRHQFKKVADTAGPFHRFHQQSPLSLNAIGRVAFWSELDNGIQGIFTGDGHSVSYLATNHLSHFGIQQFGSPPSINAANTVAFVGSQRGNVERVYLHGGGRLTPIDGKTRHFHTLGQPVINSTGTVVFLAGLQGHGGGIFSLDRGAVTTIAHTSGPFSGFFDRPAINDKGTVVFSGQLDTGRTGIFTSRNGKLLPIADTSSTFRGFGPPVINNRGTVVFWACTDGVHPTCPRSRQSSQGIYFGNGGPITTLVDTLGPFQSLGNPTVNNPGTISFVGTLDNGTSGIFSGPHPVHDKVIAVGDSLAGSQVERLDLLQGLAFNDLGQIAFFAKLKNGVEGIYLATP